MLKIRTSRKFIELIRILISLLIAMILMEGCESSDENSDDLIGNWIELSDFEGVPRTDAVAFTIADKGYVGLGYDGEDRLKDFWEYDPVINNWTRIADFPGVARNGAVAFGTDSKGYVGTGYDGSNRLNDFYEYDPVTGEWTQIADFGGSARYGAVAFAIDNKGYVGTGYDGNALKDFWQYDPGTLQWTPIVSLGGGKRTSAAAFVINGKGYVCTGIDNGSYETDFWEYTPGTNTWKRKRDIADISDKSYDDDYDNITGINKAAFTVNGRGYLATGGKSTTSKVVWEYHPDTDLWEEKASLEGSSRLGAVGFAIDTLGFICTGTNGSYYFDDIWGFQPDEEQVDNDTFDSILN